MADDARSVVANALAAFGLEDLADWVMENVVEGTDVMTTYLKLRETDAYKKRFPAMAELQKKAQAGGRGYTEADYINIENGYREALSMSGLPPEMWDSADDFANLMRGEVSPLEVQRRVDAAKEAVLSTDPSTREQMQRLYGITAQDLMAYALVPDRGSDYIRRMATTAIMAGMSSDQGLGADLTAAQWERYAGEAIQSDMGFGQMRGAVAAARGLVDTQSRLASVEGERFTGTDALDVTIGQDAGKALASERRARREKARFSGRSGATTGTLGSQGL